MRAAEMIARIAEVLLVNESAPSDDVVRERFSQAVRVVLSPDGPVDLPIGLPERLYAINEAQAMLRRQRFRVTARGLPLNGSLRQQLKLLRHERNDLGVAV